MTFRAPVGQPIGPVTARLCDLATLLIGVIPRLWRGRSAGFHVRNRSLLTFCRSVTGCCPRVGGREGAFRNSDSPRNTSFVKSPRAACRSIALNWGGVPPWPKCTASRSLPQVLPKPSEGCLLHAHVEAMRARVELAQISVSRAGLRVVGRHEGIRVVHALDGELGVVEQKLHEEWRGRGARGEIGPIAFAAPSGGKEHPGVRRDASVEQPFIGAHHAGDGARRERFGRRAQQGGAQAAAREADAADAPGVDVLPREKVVEPDAIFVGDHRRQAGAQQRAVFRDQVLMQIGGAVVSDDLRRSVLLLKRRPDRFGQRPLAVRHDLKRKLAASPQERVMDKHDKSFPGEKVGIGATAIIGLPEAGERSRKAIGPVRDLLLAEELEMAVIVKGVDTGQRRGALNRLQDEGVGPRPEPDGPGNLFPADAVRLPSALDADFAGLLVADREAEHFARLAASVRPRR